MLKKKTIKVFGNKYYLLGTREDGMNVYMQEPEWQCGWYWGGLYLTCFTNNRQPEKSRDINSHQHFDSLFLNDSKVNAFDAFKEFFKETTLNDNEIWTLIDYMNSFYTLKKAAAMLGRGYSHITEKAKLEEAKNVEMAKEINEKILPAIFKQIDIMLSGSKEEENGGDN